jgi:hypothetical protein
MLIALAIELSCTAQPPPSVSCRSEIADRGVLAIALGPAIKLPEPTACVQIPIAHRYR